MGINTLFWSFLGGFRRVFVKEDILVGKLERAYFKRGDRVETRTGEEGRVWRILRSVNTDEIVGCVVIWDTEYKGEKYSMFVPAEDYGVKFNPILRKITD